MSACGGTPAATSWVGASAGEDTVYVAYTNRVTAVRVNDGSMAWQYPAESSGQRVFYASPEPTDGQVVVGDYSFKLVGLDAANGSEKWSFDRSKGRYVGGFLAVDGTILAPSADHTLYALNDQGEFLWEFTTGNALWARPASDGELVFQPSMDHNLYALQLTDGTQAWKTDLGGAAVYSPILSEDGVLYLGTMANEVLAIQASDGSVLWRFEAGGAIWTRPVLHEGSLYFGDIQGNIYSVDPQSGDTNWRVETGDTVVGSPGILPDGLVFVSEKGNVLEIGFDGQRLWTQTISGKLYTSPQVFEDRIVVPVTQGEQLLVAFDFKGNVIWNFAPPK
ncbi:MAG: PQQ-like beta-propeller repeat protein [Chloroflexi bacterium]|nr:PQQ-binding-like beta-propeller repeat protein [Anaerolineaceae bacterium]NMB87521.1 PQQ-like beta-propeller repeat protein [Chloroflexota bacterium]